MTSASSRRLFLIRHGETEGESSIRFHGANDVALSATGHEQVRATAPVLAAERFAACVHSPMRRAAVSAEIVLAALDHAPPVVEVDRDLREIHFGKFEGMTDEEIRDAEPEWHAAWKRDEVPGYPCGDEIVAFRDRCASAVQRFLERHPAGDLLLIAHKGVLNSAMHALCDLPLSAVRAQEMDLASLWVLREGQPWTIERRNVTGPSAASSSSRP